MPLLAAGGYFVIAPDQRGYDESDKPPGVAAYGIIPLVSDVRAICEWSGVPSCHLVGHDWGGMVGWWMVRMHPEWIDRFIAINIPHPSVFGETIKRSPSQRRRSRYIAFFQLPILPEIACRAFGFRLLIRSLVRTSRPGTFSDAVLEEYRRSWARPGALRSMIHWYRALRIPVPKVDRRVHLPTLILWGSAIDFSEAKWRNRVRNFATRGPSSDSRMHRTGSFTRSRQRSPTGFFGSFAISAVLFRR